MNSDDSSMGDSFPGVTRRKDTDSMGPGKSSLQVPRHDGKKGSGISLVTDESYAVGPNTGNFENSRNGLNAAFGGVNLSGGSDFAGFGFLLPKGIEDTFGAESRSRAATNLPDDASKLGKRLLSTVAGQTDFSNFFPGESQQASKFRKIDEEERRKEPTSYASGVAAPEPVSASRKTIHDRAEKPKIPLSKKLQVKPRENINLASPSSKAVSDSEWEARFQQRERQVEIGKATSGYKAYVSQVPKERRSQNDPSTPDARERISKRQFDGKLHKWRQSLHSFE